MKYRIYASLTLCQRLFYCTTQRTGAVSELPVVMHLFTRAHLIMKLNDLIKWQWMNYSKAHGSRLNLIIHIITTPLFIAGIVWFCVSLFQLDVIGMIASLLIASLAFGLQGFGHSKEEHRAEPFTSVGQAIVRIFLEQFFTFPRFVLSGNWFTALRNAN